MLAVDGNFHLQRNHKGKPDYPLSGNHGFWVDQGEFDDYIMAKQAKHDDDARVRGFPIPDIDITQKPRPVSVPQVNVIVLKLGIQVVPRTSSANR